MANLAVEIAGVTFKNPIVVGSGTPTTSATAMIKCIEAGAGGIVSKTATYDPMHQIQPRPRFSLIHPDDIFRERFFSLSSIELMADLKPEEYAKEIEKTKSTARQHNCVLIASIAGRNYEEWEKLAKLMETSGADMIELNLSCPHLEPGETALMGRSAGTSPELSEKIVRAVKKSTSLPVIGKLTPDGANPVVLAKAMVQGGADAVVATARFQGLVIDVDSMRPELWGGYGAYGGSWLAPISCRWVARLMESKIGVPVFGSAGVTNEEDVVRFLLVGADAVQMCTAIIVKGLGLIRQTVTGLEKWMAKHGFEEIASFRGAAFRNIVPFERLDRTTELRSSVDASKCIGCGRCAASCFYEAATMADRKAKINTDSCVGCGLCDAICPVGAIALKKIR
jgi:dihydroorotate dehydrogenase subfamily 1